MKHEVWNIIQEHMVLWLDAFLASNPPNNTQYMQVYNTQFAHKNTQYASPVNVFLNAQKNKSKTINARRKTKTVLKSALNSSQSYGEIFWIFETI